MIRRWLRNRKRNQHLDGLLAGLKYPLWVRILKG